MACTHCHATGHVGADCTIDGHGWDEAFEIEMADLRRLAAATEKVLAEARTWAARIPIRNACPCAVCELVRVLTGAHNDTPERLESHG
jgi:hypothetical protein